MKDRILILGGCGFIGAFTAMELLERGHEVILFDLFPPSKESEVFFLLKEKQDQMVFVQGNILDFPFLLETIKNYHINKIIHGVAENRVEMLRDRPYSSLKTNIEGAMNVFEASRILDIERIAYISSISVYAPKIYEPIDEYHPIITPGEGPSLLSYSPSKAAAELIGMHYWADQGLSIAHLRLSGVYGFGMKYPMYIKPIVENAVFGIPTYFEAGGDAKRDLVYVKDVAQGIRLSLEAEEHRLKSRIYNIASGEMPKKVWDVKDIVLRKIPSAGIYIGSGMDEQEEKIDRVRGQLSIKLAKTELNYQPAYSLEAGIEEYIHYLKGYREATVLTENEVGK